MMALGALAAIQEIGLKCPEEISLLGFDDFYWSTLLRPRLTVVRQPAQRNRNDRRAGSSSTISKARRISLRRRYSGLN